MINYEVVLENKRVWFCANSFIRVGGDRFRIFTPSHTSGLGNWLKARGLRPSEISEVIAFAKRAIA
jgi:hypothetical protein